MTRSKPLRTADYPRHLAYEMRNALAHGYFTVDLDIVWATVKTDLPGMKTQLASLTL